ncbi:pullulanase, partial [Acinetobacter baumannii]|nr:pullulanase [Acinetobacter baumannii]
MIHYFDYSMMRIPLIFPLCMVAL